MYDQPIRRIMNTAAVTVEIAASLEEAKRVLRQQPLDCVPVLSGTRLVGVLYARDLLAPDVHSVADAMRVELQVVRDDAVIADVFEILAQGGAQMVPVVNADHDLLGTVTATALLASVLEASAAAAQPAVESTLVEIRSTAIPQPSDENYHRALQAAFRMHGSQDKDGIGQALLYVDRRNLVLDKAFNIARRYLFAGQSPQELSRLRRALEDVRDFDEKTGQSRRIPTGRM